MPWRSCGSKTRPRSRHRATGTPSGPDQRGAHHGSRVHTAHRNGVNLTAARYQAGRRRGRLRATCPQGYAIPDGSAGAPRDDTFCHRARSSSRSKPLGETGMGYCTRYARLTSYTGQLWVDKPDGLFRGQPPRGGIYLMRVNRSYTLTAVVAFASFLALAAGAEAATVANPLCTDNTALFDPGTGQNIVLPSGFTG